jgi:serine/threonine-protein kinase/endoribonuclease IRE1
MGLGKQLVGQSSLGVSLVGESSFRGSKAGASSIGVGPGSVGWQAPEVMALRLTSDMSAQSNDSTSNALESKEMLISDQQTNPRTSRSVDIFSLGCIFYSLLVPGSHPFGEWFEREANIMHNRPNLDPLKSISIEAYDLVRSMLERNPRLRPTAKEVCQHPFFWEAHKKLIFLCDVSDRLETENPQQTSVESLSMLAIERGAFDVVGSSWEAKLDGALVDNVQKFRTYDFSCVRDLLRLIRNKHHHFDELPESFRKSTAPNQNVLCEYFESQFPGLVMHCYNFCRTNLENDDVLFSKYEMRSVPKIEVRPSMRPAPVSVVVKQESESETTETYPIDDTQSKAPSATKSDWTIVEDIVSTDDGLEQTTKPNAASAALNKPSETKSDVTVVPSSADQDIIVWEGSAAAKAFNCRGWSRSEDEWSRHIEPFYKKRDPNLKRCMDDPKYRTRLCNHWDTSLGMQCPMRKKNKCVFAHGPAELRVKEGKKNRWGKLVDKNGNNSNPWHSGGEDTFGAANSIEKVRKEEGKWNTSKVNKKKNAGPANSNKGKNRIGAAAQLVVPAKG